MIAADRDHARPGDGSLLKHDEFGGTGTDVGETHAEFALVGTQHRVGGSERLEDGVVDVNAGFVHGGDDVLRRAGGSRHHVDAHFEACGHHAKRIVDAGLLVEDEFLRKKMEDLAIGGQGDGAGALDGLLDLVAADLARTRAQADASMAVDAAHVRSADADDGVLDGSAGDIFGGLDRFLNRCDGFVEFYDDALARAAGFGDAVSAIAQAGVGELRHQRARLGAAYINCR